MMAVITAVGGQLSGSPGQFARLSGRRTAASADAAVLIYRL